MLPPLSDIRTRRKHLGLTQSELAQQSGVSQSLIAKIESGQTIPSYDKAKKLLDYLETLDEKNNVCARDLMTPRVLTVQSSDTVRKAVRQMEQHSVSQLPVLTAGQIVGTLQEKDVLLSLGKTVNPLDLGATTVESLMTDSLPQISPDTPFGIVSALLGHHDAVLVSEKGKLSGILTKSDLLKVILNRKRNAVMF